MIRHVALLRGINVGGHRKVPMQALRTLAEDAGFRDVQTYVASGNLVLASDAPARLVEQTLERVIERQFGFAVDVVARSRDQWADYLASHPFGADGDEQPNLAMLCIGKAAATDEDVAALRARAGDNERVERRGDAL